MAINPQDRAASLADGHRPAHRRASMSLVREITYDGRHRERCLVCDKVAYRTEAQAQRAAVAVSGSAGVPFTFYEGSCSYWHIAGGHGTKRGQRGRTSIRLPARDDASLVDIQTAFDRAAQFDRARRRAYRGGPER